MPLKVLSISHSEARELMDAAIESTRKHNVPGAIAIVDRGGHPILMERTDGTMNAAPNIAMGKAATAVSFQRETKAIEDVILHGRSPMLALNNITPLPYVPLLGGHPIVSNGQIVGGIAVAGTMDAKMDDIVAKEALENGLKEMK